MQNSLGEFFSVLCAVLWAIAVVLFRVTARDVPALQLNLFKNLFGVALLIPTLFFLPSHLQWLTPAEWQLLVISGIIGIALADTLFLYALDIIGASRSAILSCAYSPFVIILSIALLDDRLNPTQSIGFLLVILGVLYATFRKPGKSVEVPILGYGIVLHLFADFLMAAGVVLAKPVLEAHSPVFAAAIRLSAGLVGGLIWILLRGNIVEAFAIFKTPLPWFKMSIAAFFGSYLAMMVWLAGFKYTSASVSSILNQTSVFFILIFAALFLNEKLTVKKGVGAILGFIGVAIIVYR